MALTWEVQDALAKWRLVLLAEEALKVRKRDFRLAVDRLAAPELATFRKEYPKIKPREEDT